MSAKKKLLKAIRDKRVVAMPSKKIKRIAEDANGNPILDKDGVAVVEEVQLYKVKPMR